MPRVERAEIRLHPEPALNLLQALLLSEALSQRSVGEIDQVGFTDSEIGTIVSGFTDCVDLGELMAQSLVADGTVSADDAECVADKFDGDLIERLLASTFSGEDLQSSAVGEDLFEAIFGIFVECDISF